MAEPARTLLDLAGQGEFRSILVRHGYRGLRVQQRLRFALLAFLVASAVFVPPAHDRTTTFLIAAAYAVFTFAAAWWIRTGSEAPIRYGWVLMLGDIGALGLATLIAGVSSGQSWTADLLASGFFIIPVLAATQLRPRLAASVCIPAVCVYFAASWATKSANTEPWSSILLRTAAIAAVAGGCIALSAVQRSRVETIGNLLSLRTELLGQLNSVEERERRALAEALHDGALQYLLAARFDLDDLAAAADAETDLETLGRLRFAVEESATLLRSTVRELHPAVLDQSGLAAALDDLAAGTQRRSTLDVHLDRQAWPTGTRTDSDELLFGAARELIANVEKHAGASSLTLMLALRDDQAVLVVADDGRGLGDVDLAARLAEGHIGLASRRTRIAAAGGTLELADARPGTERPGTVATVSVPVSHSRR